MSALHPRNNARADHKPGRRFLQHLLSSVLIEEFGSGRDYVELLPGEIERLVNGRRRRRGGVYILARAVKRQSLTVVEKFLVRGSGVEERSLVPFSQELTEKTEFLLKFISVLSVVSC